MSYYVLSRSVIFGKVVRIGFLFDRRTCSRVLHVWHLHASSIGVLDCRRDNTSRYQYYQRNVAHITMRQSLKSGILIKEASTIMLTSHYIILHRVSSLSDDSKFIVK